MNKPLKVTASAGPDGKITLYIGYGIGSMALDLDYLLRTELYREGYPQIEVNRLRHMQSVRYDYTKDNEEFNKLHNKGVL